MPKEVIIIAPSIRHSEWAYFRCKDGFKLHGDDRTQCRFGSWTDYRVECEPGN